MESSLELVTTFEPWERTPDETPQAWEAFQVYRDQGLGRTAVKVAKQLNKHAQTMVKWCADHNWVARCAAWDAHCDARRREALLVAIDNAGKRHALIATDMQRIIRERMRTLEPDKLSPRDLAYWVDVAIKLERQALGMETAAKLEITGKDGAPLEAYLGRLSDDQLYALAKQTLVAYEAAKDGEKS